MWPLGPRTAAIHSSLNREEAHGRAYAADSDSSEAASSSLVTPGRLGIIALTAVSVCAAVAARLHAGYRAQHGVRIRQLDQVLSACESDTGGTCNFFEGCDSSRGAALCTAGRCICPAGYCAAAGRCIRKEAGHAADALSGPSTTGMAVSVVRDAFDLEAVHAGSICQNTHNWANGWTHCAYEEGGHDPKNCLPTPGGSWPSTRGWACQAYADLGWCQNGTVVHLPIGAGWGSPQKHCCVCGGGQTIQEDDGAGAAAAPEAGPGSRVALVIADPSRAACSNNTGGTCQFDPHCHSFRGPTICVDGRCLCKAGYCADQAGTCHRQSPTTTPMAVKVVRTALGLTRTAPGTVCQSKPLWVNLWSHCAYEEGGNRSELCQPTFGGHWPSTAGWTCLAYVEKGWCSAGKPTWGAPTGFLHNFPEKHCCACGGGRIVTDEEAKAVAKQLKRASCSRSTGGSCKSVGVCQSWRGEVDCEAGVCQCREGYCAGVSGACHKDVGLLTAAVVPVNLRRPYFPGDQARIRTAVCISGGGSRSLAAALGHLRALHHLGLMHQVDALSSVSGGTWAAAIYMFADRDAGDLLGSPVKPEELTLEKLRAAPAPLGMAATFGMSGAALRLLAREMPIEMLWVKLIADVIMKPFGLDKLDSYMAPDNETVARVKRRNPQLADQVFLTPSPGRPKVFVMGATVEAPDGFRASDDNVVALQMSPDFTGSPFYPDNSAVTYFPAVGTMQESLRDVLVGGGLVESFAFGGEEPLDQQSGGGSVWLPGPATPFSLAEAVSISSAGLAGLATQIGLLDLSPGEKFNSQKNLWPVTSEGHPRRQRAFRYQLGDGGNLDNTGLLAMLQRRASKIVSFVNSGFPVSRDVDFCKVPADYDPAGKVVIDLSVLFGVHSDKEIKGAEFYARNQVFAKEELLGLLCDFGKLLKEGKPLVVRHRRLLVQANSWWGIAGGNTIDIVFVILEKSQEFEQLLPNETQKELTNRYSGLRNFPLYKTVFQTADLTALTASQVNILASQAEYSVVQNAGMFRNLLR